MLKLTAQIDDPDVERVLLVMAREFPDLDLYLTKHLLEQTVQTLQYIENLDGAAITQVDGDPVLTVLERSGTGSAPPSPKVPAVSEPGS